MNSPTGRRLSQPAMQYLKQAHKAEKEMNTIRNRLLEAGFTIRGDEAYIDDPNIDYTQAEARIMAWMQTPKGNE